ncbi:PemI protein [Bartonella schoenbuchensis]|uniref:Antitoxin ChpS n=2 Tax=Bartonella schoenbuchensis TaxID=165694 RepID=E6Z0M3_BARSR|nr:PemI protein [Bartonella schoenbuchensis]AQX31564.1 antitoxin ChpS [Bartonella schoenbuchensis R1]ENN90489.1 PemI protein [Bartonella schoenbuchensis m07a]CBI82661.1 Protein pemI [Bartonella schoenbuchensis R1]
MHTTKLRKVGGSVMLSIPPALLDVLHLVENTEVGLTIDNGCLIVQPQIFPSYTLDELLAQCDPLADLSDEETEWLDAKPVSRELL